MRRKTNKVAHQDDAELLSEELRVHVEKNKDKNTKNLFKMSSQGKKNDSMNNKVETLVDEEAGLTQASAGAEESVKDIKSSKKDKALDNTLSGQHEETGVCEGPVDGGEIKKPLIGEKASASSTPSQVGQSTTSEIAPLTGSATRSSIPSTGRGPSNMIDSETKNFVTFMDTLDREKEERVQALSEDIYSLVYTAQAKSQAFWFAIFVSIVQNTILWLILFDLIDLDSAENTIKLPPGVPIMVNIAQAAGVLLIVFTVAVFGDLTTGLSRLTEGYDNSVLDDNPYAFRIKWFMAGFLQLKVGMLMAADLFILMMQSTTVVGMCLNFAALHFVQVRIGVTQV